MHPWQTFLSNQRMLSLATVGEQGPWSTTVYYGFKNNKIYFISPQEAEHSQHIIANPTVSFAAAWHKENDHTDRKGIQGSGTCHLAKDDNDIITGVTLHNEYFPEFADRITPEWIKNPENKSGIWIITPTRIKYWDDELYKEDKIIDITL